MPRCPPAPALLISACSGWPSARNSSAQRRTDARSPRSSGKKATAGFPVSATIAATAARPFGSDRQAANTLPPRPARAAAVARPIPVLAPVARNVRPARSPDAADMIPSYRTAHPAIIPAAAGRHPRGLSVRMRPDQHADRHGMLGLCDARAGC
jgi:hypothetical protein